MEIHRKKTLAELKEKVQTGTFDGSNHLQDLVLAIQLAEAQNTLLEKLGTNLKNARRANKEANRGITKLRTTVKELSEKLQYASETLNRIISKKVDIEIAIEKFYQSVIPNQKSLRELRKENNIERSE